MKVYLKSIAQISAQKPFSTEWMTDPLSCDEPIWPTQEADYSKFISPLEGRRMGKMLKRAIATSRTCLDEAGVEHPDAIITGTGLGCVQHSEAVITELCFNGDDSVKPTNFMQSTHNTVGSVIGIRTRSHGYNCSYSQEALSFENSLADALTQLHNGRISNALVSSFDEISPKYHIILSKSAYLAQEGEYPASESAVSAFLDSVKENAICRVAACRVLWCPNQDRQAERLAAMLKEILDESGISIEDIDMVLAGLNGSRVNDQIYERLCPQVFGESAVGTYKNLFGENLSVSAMGFYVAAECLRAGHIPESVCGKRTITPRNILLFNHFDGKDFSLTLLTKE